MTCVLSFATEKAFHGVRQRVSNLSIHQNPWQASSKGVPADLHPGASGSASLEWTPSLYSAQFREADSAGLLKVQINSKSLHKQNNNKQRVKLCCGSKNQPTWAEEIFTLKRSSFRPYRLDTIRGASSRRGAHTGQGRAEPRRTGKQ